MPTSELASCTLETNILCVLLLEETVDERLKGEKSASVTVGLFTLLGNAGSRGEPSSVQCCIAVALRCIVLQLLARLAELRAHSGVTVDPRWQPAGWDLAQHCRTASFKLLPAISHSFAWYYLILPSIA